jgi:ABC-2 type transport system permease protein
MQWISWSIPLTRGIEAARRVIAGASLVDVGPLVLGEFLIGLAYITAGYTLFRVFEAEAKRRGTLEAF